MPNIIGESLKKYVANQISVRQNVHGSGVNSNRTPEQLSYLNSKTAWVKLASGINISSSRIAETDPKLEDGYAGNSLATHNVLYSGISSLEDYDDKSGILKPRGTYADVNNITDYFKGTYNITGLSKEDSSRYGLAPMPGITSVEIKSLNRGSIKRATVNIKCYTPEQFQIIDLLYLRIGYTMFLEWGSSLYLDDEGKVKSMGYTLIEDKSENGFFSTKWKNRSHLGFLPVIEGYRKGKLGNYDGLLAKVANFSWTFAQDGSYDIELSLISLGDVIESLKLNITPSQDVITFINAAYALYKEEGEKEEATSTPTSDILSAYLFLQKLYLDKNTNTTSGYDNESREDERIIYSTIGDEKLQLGGVFVNPTTDSTVTLDPVDDESELFDTELDAKNWVIANHPEVTSNYLGTSDTDIKFKVKNSDVSAYGIETTEAAGEGVAARAVTKYKAYTHYIPTINFQTEQGKKDVAYLNYNPGEDGDINQIQDSGFYMRFGHLLDFIKSYIIPKVEGTNTKMIELDSGQWSNVMYTFPYQVSLDPRVCLVNGLEKVRNKDYWPSLVNWKNSTGGYAWIMNIYVSHNQILSSLNSNKDEDGNVSLFNFLSDICDALNKALGGVNNLEPIIDEEENTIRIVDSSYSPNKKEPYTLELYGYNTDANNVSNFVRNFELKTELTNDFATMATIGSTAGGYVKGVENTMFSKWNKGLIDRFKEKYTPGNKSSKSSLNSDEDEARVTYLTDFWRKRYSAFGLTLLDVDGYFENWSANAAALNDELIDRNVAVVTEFYRYCQYRIQQDNEKYSSPTNGFIPISLNITMDGIAGIKIYNALNVSTRFLPKNYGDSLKFIIKGVNHKLQDNDWETTIETVVIAYNGDGGKDTLTYQDIKKQVDKVINEAAQDVIADARVSVFSSSVIQGDTSDITCEVGADSGVVDGYKQGKRYKIRLCNVQGIRVNSQIATRLNNMINAAKADGITLRGSGYRSLQGQIEAGRANGCPANWTNSGQCRIPTAPPGYSNHQMGFAVDFQKNGVKIKSSSAEFKWLTANAGRFGFYNLPSESWHWSIDGK